MRKNKSMICIESAKDIKMNRHFLLLLIVPYVVGTLAISVIWLLFMQPFYLLKYIQVILICTLTYYGLWMITYYINKLHNYRVCYDFDRKEIFFIDKSNNKIKLKISLEDISEIIISPKEKKTNIITNKSVNPFTGTCIAIHSGNIEFSLILGEEFKKYWEEKGYYVIATKKYYRIVGGWIHCYQVDNTNKVVVK